MILTVRHGISETGNGEHDNFLIKKGRFELQGSVCFEKISYLVPPGVQKYVLIIAMPNLT